MFRYSKQVFGNWLLPVTIWLFGSGYTLNLRVWDVKWPSSPWSGSWVMTLSITNLWCCLQQSNCFTYSSQSNLLWTHQTHRNWLPFSWREDSKWHTENFVCLISHQVINLLIKPLFPAQFSFLLGKMGVHKLTN